MRYGSGWDRARAEQEATSELLEINLRAMGRQTVKGFRQSNGVA